jgi:hypothetical protein
VVLWYIGRCPFVVAGCNTPFPLSVFNALRSMTRIVCGQDGITVGSSLSKGLPLDVQWMVLERMALDASVSDWVSVRQVSRLWRKIVTTVFTEWLKKQSAGGQFGHFAGSAAEVKFVMDHVQGRVIPCGIVCYG